MTNRQLFFTHLGQTSTAPVALEIAKASGAKLYDVQGNEYIDLIGGISVCNIGHCHPAVIAAIKRQMEQYLHVMVYGELIQSPQVRYAELLARYLPSSLNAVFFTSSGSEATEGAMKLAKRATARTEIVSFKNSYHGSTQGALSLMGSEYWKQPFRPLLPGTVQLEYNSFHDLQYISTTTAAVVAETIQAEAGVKKPESNWLKALQKKCNEMGVLLILDEIQCGFGRNGTLWAFEQFDVVPDILLLGKALGGGMPLGAFVADKKLMDMLSINPVLGHINTFGGHPICCAAGMAAMEVLLKENLIAGIAEKEKLFTTLLKHNHIKAVRSAGLMIAVEFDSFDCNKQLIDALIARVSNGHTGVFTDWFLFADNCLRIAPPLIISEAEIKMACEAILQALANKT